MEWLQAANLRNVNLHDIEIPQCAVARRLECIT
jgi:hypothetical protein